nr:hypothetical protein [Tanacetum cinerariifolium]
MLQGVDLNGYLILILLPSKVVKETVSAQQYVLLLLWSIGSKDPQNSDVDAAFEVKDNDSEVHVSPSSRDKPKKHDEKAKREAKGKIPVDLSIGVRDLSDEFEEFFVNSTNRVNAASAPVTVVGPNSTNSTNSFNTAGPSDNDMPALEDIVYSNDEDDVGAEAEFSNLETSITVSLIPTTRVYKDHPVIQIISDLTSAPQTRIMTRMVKEQGGLNQINDEDFHTCMFVCFLSQKEPKRVHQALKDPSWIEATQEELLQFKMQKVWVLVDLPKGKRVVGSKWVFRNKKDEEGLSSGIKLDFKVEAIQLFLAYASFMGFMVYQMDVKSAFLYGTIKEEVYVCQPLGFKDHDYPNKVYKVVKALYGLHQAPRAWYETLAKYLLENGFQRGKIDQTLFIKTQKGDILLVQVYVDDIIFGSTNKELSSTPIDTEKPLLKDPDGKDVDVHIYRSMIGSLMYLTSSRQNIMFAVCACACFQVTLKLSHFHAVKRIFSNYAGASLDRKSTTGGCQFPGLLHDIYSLIDSNKTAKDLWDALARKMLGFEYGDQDRKAAFLLIITAVSYTLMLFDLMKDAVHLMLLEDTIRQDLRLDDADGVECLPNEEIFAELAHMGYEKPPPTLKFYKVFFLAQWKFLIHTII